MRVWFFRFAWWSQGRNEGLWGHGTYSAVFIADACITTIIHSCLEFVLFLLCLSSRLAVTFQIICRCLPACKSLLRKTTRHSKLEWFVCTLYPPCFWCAVAPTRACSECACGFRLLALTFSADDLVSCEDKVWAIIPTHNWGETFQFIQRSNKKGEHPKHSQQGPHRRENMGARMHGHQRMWV